MPAENFRVLMLEDVAADAELELRELARAGIQCVSRVVVQEAEFRQALKEFEPDVILSDYSLPAAFDGLTALAIAQQECPDVPFVFVSGTIGEERAIESLKHGATDYVLKTNLSRLASSVLRAVQEASERRALKEAERALRESERRFSQFMRHLPGVAFIKDLQGCYLYLNEPWEHLFQKKLDAVLGRRDEEIWPPEVASRFKASDEAVIEKRQPLQTIEAIPWEGKIQHWLISKFPITDEAGKPMMIGGVGIDITERKEQELKIARLSRIHEVLSGINSAIVRIRDREELFREACCVTVEHGGFRMAWIGLVQESENKVKPVAWRGFEEGYLEEVGALLANFSEDPGVGWHALKEKRPVVANDIATDPDVAFKQAALARGYRSLAALPLLVGGKAVGIFVLYSDEPGYFNGGELKLLTELASDISFALEYLEKEERLSYLAYYDVLTGLPNHTLFRDRLNQALAAARHEHDIVAVVMVDLERFRNINDTFGRHVGDALLRQVGERLQTVAGDAESLARVSADSFAGMLTGLKKETDVVRLVDEKLQRVFATPFQADGNELHLSARAGIALFPSDGDDADALLRNAEAALKKAKASAEKFLFYTPEMNARVAEKLSLENRLRQALDKEQFVLHYQPKVELESGRVSGLEALLRWNDPDTGLVPPGKFIPILEETGMILEVGRWVLEQSASDFLKWRSQGLRVPRVAVNVSPIQLRQKDFVRTVEKVLERCTDKPHGLELEITESLIMEDIEDNIPKLKALRDMTVSIAIDDFGTGYSSLSYIARLPVNSLKIDRSFIVNMEKSSDSMTIVSAIISLAHSLNLKVVAEGVETEDQRHLLKLLRCNELQGYIFSPPLPAEKIKTLLTPDNGAEKV